MQGDARVFKKTKLHTDIEQELSICKKQLNILVNFRKSRNHFVKITYGTWKRLKVKKRFEKVQVNL